MSEEKPEEMTEAKENKEEKAEVKEVKQEKEAAKQDGEKEEEAPAIKETHAKKIKVTQMTMNDVDKAIEETTKRMGGLHSRYGRSLLERKQMLKKMPLMARKQAA